MQRFLMVFVPLVLPFVIYGIYLHLAKRSGRDLRSDEQKLKPFVWALCWFSASMSTPKSSAAPTGQALNPVRQPPSPPSTVPPAEPGARPR